MRAAVAALSFLLALPALAEDAPPKPPAPPPAGAAAPKQEAPKKIDDSKALYGVGLAVAHSLEVFSLSPSEVDQVIRGIRDGIAGKPKTPYDQSLQAAVNDLARTRMPKAAEKAAKREKEAGPPYLAKMAKQPNAKKTPAGAVVITEKEGTGPSPKETDKVRVNYTGTLVNGQVFDSSAGRGPAEFPLAGVVKCWTEALQTMKVGGRAKIVCPPEIAYGAQGHPPVIPGNAVLTFDVELLEVVPPAPPAK